MERQRAYRETRTEIPASARRDGRWRISSSLPSALTSFVGRTREIADIRTRLRETRLLTLTGVGGVGKSRLALQVAEAVRDEGRSEVRLVELAGLADPAHVQTTLAATLGVRDAGDEPLADALLASIGRREVLLLLDNCEHLAGVVAELLVILLRGCPNLRVLTTSRIPLGLGGESDWRVGPLPVPAPGRLPTRTALHRYAAVRLFL